MNISQQTIDQLKASNLVFGFYDQYMNTVSPEQATEINISFEMNGEIMNYIGKSIKATKKEMTFDYIMNKLCAESAYKNFSEYFNTLLRKRNLYSFMNCYPTSYGIGVFVAINYRNVADKMRESVAELLGELGVKYSTEYSDAHYVFRFKISKSSDNIERIKEVIA